MSNKSDPLDPKRLLENDVNRAAGALQALRDGAHETRFVITKENAEKIINYLRILLDNLAQDLERLATTNVPPPGKFTLDANIPRPHPSIPPKPLYRSPEPEGRLVGQRPNGAATLDDDGVGFIQE